MSSLRTNDEDANAEKKRESPWTNPTTPEKLVPAHAGAKNRKCACRIKSPLAFSSIHSRRAKPFKSRSRPLLVRVSILFRIILLITTAPSECPTNNSPWYFHVLCLTGALAVNISEAARRLGLSPRTVAGLISRRELPSRKVGRRRIIPVRALEAFVTRDYSRNLARLEAFAKELNSRR